MADVVLIDPLGRRVMLREGTWRGHILRRHPELMDHRDSVEDAIRRPRQIQISGQDAGCRIYLAPGLRPGIMIKVVADTVGGFVKTAHFTRKIPNGAVEWPH